MKRRAQRDDGRRKRALRHLRGEPSPDENLLLPKKKGEPESLGEALFGLPEANRRSEAAQADKPLQDVGQPGKTKEDSQRRDQRRDESTLQGKDEARKKSKELIM
eukprot:TRINITY_DN14657_c0_g1_i1.p1 TRINITY_DN14657_c0_g1~~TRINITY_DN14657_c0_g1_i1.p1  ORF type:complete len:105 (-),score=27.20 TRINITY_DN14657_c0_g1_i1:565-879(-)